MIKILIKKKNSYRQRDFPDPKMDENVLSWGLYRGPPNNDPASAYTRTYYVPGMMQGA